MQAFAANPKAVTQALSQIGREEINFLIERTYAEFAGRFANVATPNLLTALRTLGKSLSTNLAKIAVSGGFSGLFAPSPEPPQPKPYETCNDNAC